jgi:hypothetical protein
MEEPAVSEKRGKPCPQFARRPHVVRIEPRDAIAALREP